MRFINTTSLKFQDVAESGLPKLKNGYCILSHRWTWGENEITYMDVLSVDPDVKTKDSYTKFTGACSLAKRLGFDLLWIDTCCINKTDYVELGEAINSMYRWYSMAKLCIAYLQDVTTLGQIKESEWFNRGWTLQELIAPKSVQFYGRSWNYLGDKASLSNVLVSKTGIPSDVLKNTIPPQAYSAAQRMSWAANRTTTRLEDRAYSLMGLFDVNMPMIYGEQERAFTRLQEHIISKSADESIFVWDLPKMQPETQSAFIVHCLPHPRHPSRSVVMLCLLDGHEAFALTSSVFPSRFLRRFIRWAYTRLVSTSPKLKQKAGVRCFWPSCPKRIPLLG